MLWFSYMYLLNDSFNIMLNGVIVSLFAFYTLVYWYYHPKRVCAGILAFPSLTFHCRFISTYSWRWVSAHSV